jgi:NAD(P)-dependent dehydrogenase (short-subunit alcohol dehydrogenase family)
MLPLSKSKRVIASHPFLRQSRRRMNSMLLGKFALITGGGSGIGRAAALRFVEEGAAVFVVGRDAPHLDETCKLAGARCEARPCDISDERAFTKVIDDLPRIDILVNNAGVSFSWAAMNDSLDKWQRMIDINMKGSLYGSRAAARRMKQQGTGGRIVNVTSVHWTMAEVGSVHYGIAKAAVTQMTRGLAAEWAPHGILANTVAPGFVDTPMSRASGENELESAWFKQHYVDRPRIPLRRAGKAEEIAEVILFCANPRNSYMTGAVLMVDGGLSITL